MRSSYFAIEQTLALGEGGLTSLTHEFRERDPAVRGFCRCARPLVEAGLDVHIQGIPRRAPPWLICFGLAIIVARKNFLIDLGWEEVERSAYIGHVFGKKGELLDGWHTLHPRPRSRLILRRREGIQVRLCEGCGDILYGGVGPKYIFPPPPEDVRIFLDRRIIVVSSDVAKKVSLEKWHGIELIPLQVLESPPDGIIDLFHMDQ